MKLRHRREVYKLCVFTRLQHEPGTLVYQVSVPFQHYKFLFFSIEKFAGSYPLFCYFVRLTESQILAEKTAVKDICELIRYFFRYLLIFHDTENMASPSLQENLADDL